MKRKEEKVKECGCFWKVLMTLPSKIIASASVPMRLEALKVDCVCIPLNFLQQTESILSKQEDLGFKEMTAV